MTNNNGYTQKELLNMVIERLDRLEKKLDAKLDKAEFYKVLTLLVALGAVLGGIAGVMVNWAFFVRAGSKRHKRTAIVICVLLLGTNLAASASVAKLAVQAFSGIGPFAQLDAIAQEFISENEKLVAEHSS